MTWTLLPWVDLDRDRLYAALVLRQRVFVVEQDCAYLDADGLDPEALHLFGDRGSDVVAYARLLPPRVAYQDAPAIGRVVTAPEVRGEGLGRALMIEALHRVDARWPGQPCRLSAQSHLERFYRSLGFDVSGPGYLEDGIPHLPMVRQQQAAPGDPA